MDLPNAEHATLTNDGGMKADLTRQRHVFCQSDTEQSSFPRVFLAVPELIDGM